MPKQFTTILLIGEGQLTKQLGVRLLQHDHSVWALISSDGLAPGFARLGINPLAADLSEPFLAKMAVANADVIFHLANRRQHGMAAPEPTDLKALQNILSVIPRGTVKRYIYESSLAVYDNVVPGQNLPAAGIDEKVFSRPKSATGRIHLEAEREILARFSEEGFPGIILRTGALYQAVPGILDQVRRGVYSLPADLPSLFHRIYMEDYLDILVAAMEKGRPGQAYNVVDQAPHTPAEYYNQMAAMLGVPPLIPSISDPQAPPAAVRYQNEKLLREFGFTLRFPTYREGLLDGLQKAEDLKTREA
ncbi:MAG: NAD-dependent epimerase/dehydratase family protein [Candidatus Manganitrophus sp.]|nr:MAG: NAD-dependent epimerase/dehydratase family protein [Candidatus Manganitrophus sp.]